MIRALDRANSFYCPAGRWQSRGWILLSRVDYNRLDKYSTTLQLNIGNTSSADNVQTLKNLAIVQAQCVTRGLASDLNALYLVEITDGRGLVHNQWFQFPLTASYNIRSPAYPQTFHPGSMNGGTTWTWSTMIQNIWQTMGTFLGTWPGLPITPTGTPEGFWFQGVPAWSALIEVLEHIGLTIACDLTQANPFTIVIEGADDLTFNEMQTRFVGNLEDDLEWIDFSAGRAPATVKVLFRRRNSVYGTEETVRYDSLQWDMTTLYSVSVNAPATYTGGVGTHHMWSDFTVRYDHDNSPLAEDVTTATAIAQERVSQYFGRIHPRGFMSQTYAGALPFVTGTEVDGVCWYQDYRNGDRQGWRTQIVHGPGAITPWPDIWE